MFLKVAGLVLMVSLIGSIVEGKKVSNDESSGVWHGHSAGVEKTGQKYVVNNKRYPYIAFLYVQSEKGASQCGCVIIRDDLILTAAHCTDGMDASQLTVLTGSYNIGPVVDPTLQSRKVREIRQHSGFNVASPIESDLSILVLDQPLELNDYVQPIQIAAADTRGKLVGKRVRIIGWGQTETLQTSPYLKYVDLTIESNEICNIKKEAYWSRLGMKPPAKVTRNMMCLIGNSKRESAGGGDSGGPAVLLSSSNNPKEDVLVGITSWIDHILLNAQTGLRVPIAPLGSVYADVAAMRDWIDRNM